MNDSSFIGLPLLQLGQMLQKREISPVELTRVFLGRIRRLDARVNAFLRVLDDQALASAKVAEKEIMAGHYRGPLHGIPFAVKDIFDTVGTPTTAGSKIWRDFVPDLDATVVRRLRESGAVLIGKLNLHEFAWGITSRNPHYGPVLNPWDLSASCGGSSSGSAAALAAGFAPFTLGSDTGGSIRIPCSLCGTVGLKPTYGLVSRKGVFPLAWSLDHIGPLALHVEDIAVILGAIAGHDPHDMATSNCGMPDYIEQLKPELAGTVIGVPAEFFFDGLRQDVKDVVLKAVAHMEALGAQVREVDIPGTIEADLAAYTILFSEAALSLEVYARNQPQDVGEEVMTNVRIGMTIPATRFVHASRVRTKLFHDMQKVFSEVDILAVPGTCVDAHQIDAVDVPIGPDQVVDVRTAMTRFTRFFNLSGNPVLSVPCGLSSRGLPVGMQLVGPCFGESMLLSAGYGYQQAFPMKPFMPHMDC